MRITSFKDLNTVKENGLKKYLPSKIRIAVGMGTCGIGTGAEDVFKEFALALKKNKINAYLTKTGCFGFCAEEPLVNISIPGKPLVVLKKVSPKEVSKILKGIKDCNFPEKNILCKIEEWDHLTDHIIFSKGLPEISNWDEIPFFKGQKKIVLRDCGLINPEDIEEYIAVGGYSSLYKVLTQMTPNALIEEIKKSRLRGRGGAGFPTGRKWELIRQANSDIKYMVCNGDEGDPAAYMNRNESESDPHMVLEGILIGAFAVGATNGIIYIRAEYPLAVERLKLAIEQARAYGLLGKNIFGTDFNFDIEFVEGAGAFVCGEETALIESVEGKAGRPKPRPPFPAQKGIQGKPTNINNVETWSNIPAIIAKGADWFSAIGSKNSAGTKVFSLVGKIKNTGLVEMPLGASLKSIIYGIGLGTGTNKKVKSVQTGGPSGGCIPVRFFDTSVDYESLNSLGAIMGSGGMVVMDSDNCMVDVAKYFTEFTTSESCGKCTPCREGLYQILTILKRICAGKADKIDLKLLKELGDVIKDSALCGLGQTGPNPVLTTLKYFEQEYLEHIESQHCDSGVCLDLFVSPCENSCPLHMNIPGFLQLLKENKLVDSFDSIIRDNPFPASSGRICHFHCKMRCRREDIDEPVSQGEVHRYIVDTIYKSGKESNVISQLIKEKFPSTGKTIAIVGAGPAGLTAAFYLARLGHSVTIYEATSEAGGVLRWGIPEYRLPKKVLAKEIGFIKKFGAKFKFNRKIGLNELNTLKNKYDVCFLATGAYKNMGLGIPGENLNGVISGIVYLEEVLKSGKSKVGKNIVIIGAGNVAVDAARTALRSGAKVTIVYRREKADMPANKEEILEAEKEGVKFVFLAAPCEIIGDNYGKVNALKVNKMIPGEFDLSGRRKSVSSNETYEITCDTIMLAIGERVDSKIFKDFGIVLNQDETVQINNLTLKTSVDKFYAGGDLVLGPSTAVEAMSYGKLAAENIDRYLTKEERFSKLFKKFTYSNEVSLKPVSAHKQTGKKLELSKRLKGFSEISLGLSKYQALIESHRCLRCDVKE